MYMVKKETGLDFRPLAPAQLVISVFFVHVYCLVCVLTMQVIDACVAVGRCLLIADCERLHALHNSPRASRIFLSCYVGMYLLCEPTAIVQRRPFIVLYHGFLWIQICQIHCCVYLWAQRLQAAIHRHHVQELFVWWNPVGMVSEEIASCCGCIDCRLRFRHVHCRPVHVPEGTCHSGHLVELWLCKVGMKDVILHGRILVFNFLCCRCVSWMLFWSLCPPVDTYSLAAGGWGRLFARLRRGLMWPLWAERLDEFCLCDESERVPAFWRVFVRIGVAHV